MTPKYHTDSSEFIHSLSTQNNNISRQPLFKMETEKIDEYHTEEVQANRLRYFTPDYTHYCLNCRDWYLSKESVFECKIEHATVTHNKHLLYSGGAGE